MHDLPELPVIKDATVGTLRLEGTLAKRLPQMPTGDIPNLHFTNFRQEEAEKTMNDMRHTEEVSYTGQPSRIVGMCGPDQGTNEPLLQSH